MEKISSGSSDTRSADIIADNLERLKDLFPDAFTEGKVDFEILRQILGDAVDESEEKYGLSWHGKHRARQLALTPSTGTLRPCPEDSVDWKTTRNLTIEGDNLEVLKLLQKSYAGKVELIYIDPPCNTGKDFVYPDDYRNNIHNYLELTGQVDNLIRKLSSNVETSGRFHTAWINMIFPRLKLARNLLRDDGVFVVSISDAEIHNLRLCLDEIFGVDNLMGCVLWNSTKSVTNTALISVSHTYNVIYAKNRDYFIRNRIHFRLPEEGKGFTNPDNDPRGPWKADPFQVGGERPNQMYTVTNPKTGDVHRPNPGNSWKNEQKVYNQLIKDKRIVFGASGEAGPQRKRFLTDAKDRGRVVKTWWDDVGTTTYATKETKDLMKESVFDNPKPVSLIKRFIQLGTHDPDKAIAMDFFAGSGTTAQAISADGGSRRYLLVQLPELLDPEDNEQKMAAEFCKKLGKPYSITELTKERLRRAACSVKDESPDYTGDLGFRVFKLASSNIRAWDPNPDDLEGALFSSLDHVKPGRDEQDILYELLLKLGLDLCVPIETRTIAGKSVDVVGAGILIACLDKAISHCEVEPLAIGIADWHDALAPSGDASDVFRDSAFADDVIKTNLAAILEQSGLGNMRSL